jgi:hypothetical protein
LDDLIVGVWDADLSGKSYAGKSYVVFGKANGNAINLSAIADASNPTGGFVINGEARYDSSGSSVSNAGDVNPALEAEKLLASASATASPLITKPPVGLLTSAMALRSMALLLALPNTT